MRSATPYLLLLLAAACNRAPEPDAYGNVEAAEVVVSAEVGGRLVSFSIKEGETVAAETIVGAIDATELALERDRIHAQRAGTVSRVAEVGEQIKVLEAQLAAAEAQRDAVKAQRAAMEAQHEIARRAYERTQRLFSQQAATAQQVDQTERDVRVLAAQIKAHDEQIEAQQRQIDAHRRQIEATRAAQRTALQQVASAGAQAAQVAERLRKTQITNPIGGTVLVAYAKAGEFVQPGQPLYKIANLESVEVRAYVTETQLARVRLGQPAQVSADVGKDARQVFTGTVSWVSSQAEFTPTPIQTREERADLVYAVKIRVPNPGGLLKIGMPVDVAFQSTVDSRQSSVDSPQSTVASRQSTVGVGDARG